VDDQELSAVPKDVKLVVKSVAKGNNSKRKDTQKDKGKETDKGKGSTLLLDSDFD
jgi:hypothetical protein